MSLAGKLEYGLSATRDALGKARALDKKGERLLGFVRDYYKDAEYYASRDAPTALEAVAYAHGILDGGVLAGHIRIKGYHLGGEVMEVHIIGKNPNGFKQIAILFLAASGGLSAYLLYDMLFNRAIRLDFVVIAVAFLIASLSSLNTYAILMESGKRANKW